MITYQYLVDAKVLLTGGTIATGEEEEVLKALQKAARLPLLLGRDPKEHDEIIQWVIEQNRWVKENGAAVTLRDYRFILLNRIQRLLDRYSPLSSSVQRVIGRAEHSSALLWFASPRAYVNMGLETRIKMAKATGVPSFVIQKSDIPERTIREENKAIRERYIAIYLDLLNAKSWTSGKIWTQREINGVLRAIENGVQFLLLLDHQEDKDKKSY